MPQTIFDAIRTLADQLIAARHKVATAESCTGGGLAADFTELAGSSAWFDCGFVTYSNAAKKRMLAVDEQVFSDHGAVSEACVRQMVQGAIRHSEAQLAVAISGIAGPGGGGKEKPVGTVWLAWGNAMQQEAQCFLFQGDRHQVREQAKLAAVQGLLLWLEAHPFQGKV